MRARIFAAVGLGFWLTCLPAGAVTPEEKLADAALEARARGLSQLLRCVVCQNQSIDDSNAPLAHDLRVLLRERLSAGDSDKEAVAFLVARYGNFVLLKPPVQANTLALWFGPLLLLAMSAMAMLRFFRKSAKPAGTDLSADDEAHVARLLRKDQAP